MANEHYTEPIVGREKIKKKMEDLKLNDCRAKIKQIDCLETLAGGLVIQVIGELSNNGRPMRRFLQTFVLAPSTDDPRSDSEVKTSKSVNAERRTVNISSSLSANSSSNNSNNQKFFVLNSIFRYQDDGLENEFDEEVIASNNQSSNELNGQKDNHELESSQRQTASLVHESNGATAVELTQTRREQSEASKRLSDEVEKLSKDLDASAKLSSKTGINESESSKETAIAKIVPNGVAGASDRRNDTVEKPMDSIKLTTEQLQGTSSNSGQVSTTNPSPSATAKPAPPPNEPRTWATMLRNANPPTSSALSNTGKQLPSEQPQLQPQTQTQTQAHQQPQQQHQQNNDMNLPVNAQQSTQLQAQSQQQSSQPINNSSGSNINTNTNLRRRHMLRKPSNKTNGGNSGGGRSMKNRPPRPPPTDRPLA